MKDSIYKTAHVSLPLLLGIGEPEHFMPLLIALEALTEITARMETVLRLHVDSRIKRQMSFIKHLWNELFRRQYVFRPHQYFIKP